MMSHTEFSRQNSKDLMSLSEAEQFNKICVLLVEKDTIEALRVANSTLKSKKYFQVLLEKGLESANASEIEIWLKYLIPRLGLRYVINVLSQRVSQEPQQVKKAAYWIQKFLKNSNDKELNLFKN